MESTAITADSTRIVTIGIRAATTANQTLAKTKRRVLRPASFLFDEKALALRSPATRHRAPTPARWRPSTEPRSTFPPPSFPTAPLHSFPAATPDRTRPGC